MGELTKAAIATLVAGDEISGEEMRAVAGEIMSGLATPSQIAGLITGLRIRGETVDQITAFAEVMLERAAPIKTPHGPILDTVGTGGDGSGTFNISTTAALIAAGAGAVVAKHGNRGVSSPCGSADLLTALGVNIAAPIHVAERCLAEAGIAFLFAPTFHGAMKHAIEPRRDIGIRTIFNMLGPLTNPAHARRQLIGVYDGRLTHVFCEVLRGLGSERALVVHGSDGLDEITTTSATEVAELGADGSISTRAIDPNDFDLALAEPADLVGGTPHDNAVIVQAILNGEPGPKADVALLNAGAAIYIAGLTESIEAGLARARESVNSGAAREKLELLKRLSNE